MTWKNRIKSGMDVQKQGSSLILLIRHIFVAYSMGTQCEYTGRGQTAAFSAPRSGIDRKPTIHDNLDFGPWYPKGDIF